jgi:hypothetical protein
MRSDRNGCSTCPAGEERFETFETTLAGKPATLVQYDYRATSGELFSKVVPSLEDARMLRDRWLMDNELERFAPEPEVPSHMGTELTRAGVLHLSTVIRNARPHLAADVAAVYLTFLAGAEADLEEAARTAITELESFVGNY